jgi:hypothetical protein
MPSDAALDVAITWAGAAGCLFYLWTLYKQGRRGAGSQRFLMWVLAGLLLVRGFYWSTDKEILDRLTFAIATWLPLAITLFFERVLRRHHPLWVKVFVLVTSISFFATSIFTRLPLYQSWLLAFAACLTLVVLVNGALLLGRDRSELGAGENSLASLLILLAFVSAALVLSDFRTSTGIGSVRLGAIAALLFVYSMVSAALRSARAIVWGGRFLLLLGIAAMLSALMALATQSQSVEAWRAATIATWPVTYAWMLLTGIVANSRELSVESDANDFLRWLAQVSLESVEAFAASLASAPGAATHLLLEQEYLRDYRADVLARFPSAQNSVVSLARAREIRRSGDEAWTEPADQWIDLFERTQMTHGFLVRREPPAVFLLNLPATAISAAAEMRLRVMQHLSHQLDST